MNQCPSKYPIRIGFARKENPLAYDLEYFRQYHRIYDPQVNAGLKERVLSHYSAGTMACANPFNQHREPYTDIRALEIDHIHGGGLAHFRSIGRMGGNGFYKWLITRGFPEGYQVLCANCNRIKRAITRQVRKKEKGMGYHHMQKATANGRIPLRYLRNSTIALL
jgi:hypothetical protein